jgi:hypothetical protein
MNLPCSSRDSRDCKFGKDAEIKDESMAGSFFMSSAFLKTFYSNKRHQSWFIRRFFKKMIRFLCSLQLENASNCAVKF